MYSSSSAFNLNIIWPDFAMR